jgi:hypothetical protein
MGFNSAFKELKCTLLLAFAVVVTGGNSSSVLTSELKMPYLLDCRVMFTQFYRIIIKIYVHAKVKLSWNSLNSEM